MKITEFFEKYSRAALAFSGGTDSAFLMYTALICRADVKAYFVKTAFQPEFELDDAKRFAREHSLPLSVINLDILRQPGISANPENRCYLCKRAMLSAVIEAAAADGYTVVIDGTNASDPEADRPGMAALKELGVLSPLKLCGFTKDMIRTVAKSQGLDIWNKPSYSCLATRLPFGEEITPEKLALTETAEAYLSSIGLKNFRMRYLNGDGILQVSEEDAAAALAGRKNILQKLRPGYKHIYLDMEVRK